MGFNVKKTLLIASTFALATLATSALEIPESDGEVSKTAALTATDLIAIAPQAGSCDGAPFPEECADATTAATALNKAFEVYNITSKGEQAAIIAYELFESGDFKYKTNHFPEPGRSGQGTRIMAMPDYVKQYATAIVGADVVAEAEAKGGDEGLKAVLALVNGDDEKSFGSGAWFVSTQCSKDVRAGLVAETKDGWHKFLAECVNTKPNAERDPAWIAAIAKVQSV
jgi:hypothetical protein